MTRLVISFFGVCALYNLSVPAALAGPAGAIRQVTLSNTLPGNDDGSTDAIPLRIGGESGINFFGQKFTRVYVNNNGNITFESASETYTPEGLKTGVGQPIIAPFFADVDTRNSSPVMYGNATIGNYQAFVVNYVGVGYYGEHNDKLNSFQIVLLDRSDTGPGNFDIELNYNQILWETGDASGGSNGLGGTSAEAGFSNGLTGDANVYFRLPGSMVNGALIDGGPNALVSNSRNSTTPGRYVFEVRNGTVTIPPPSNGGPLTVTSVDLGTVALGRGIFGSLGISGGTPPYTYPVPAALPSGLTSGAGTLSGIPAQPGRYTVALAVQDAAGTAAAGTIRFNVFGILDAALPPGIPFSPYFASLSVAGGTAPYTYAFSGLPAGLGGNASGAVAGTVTKPGSSSVVVTVTDANGVTVSKTLSLTFSVPPPLSIGAATLAGGMVGQTYSEVLSGASGGAPPYTWSLASGALPDGLSLRGGGNIAGLPSRAGVFSFGVRATDVTGASVVGAATLTIAPIPLTIVAPALPKGLISVEYASQTITATGGVPPYTFTSANTPAGLRLDPNGTLSGFPNASGTFSFMVTATDTAGTAATASLTLTVAPFSIDLVLSGGSVDFQLTTGSVSLPMPQTINVQSSTPTVVIPFSISAGPASADWFTVTPGSSAATPGSLSIALTGKAPQLAAGAYHGTISLGCMPPAPCPTNSQTIAVNLTVKTLPPQLNVQSDLISFSSIPGTAQMLTQPLGLQNAGGGSIGFASVSCGASWCGVTGTPGSIQAGQTATVTVSADPSALTSGYYRTLLTVKASTGTTSIPVTLFVSATPSLSLQPAGQQFLSQAGGVPNGQNPSFLIDVTGSAPVNWSASVLPGASWLSVPTTSGTATASQPGQVTFALDPVVIAALPPQTYYATIRISSTGVVNSPQDFQVVLNVAPAGNVQRPNPSPAGLLFIGSATVAPPPQTVTISTSSVSPVTVQVSAATSDGAKWLSVTPSTGSAQPGNPLLTKVSVDASKLAPGVYTGGVSYAYTGLAVRTVNVTLIVGTTPKPAFVTGLSPKDAAATCAPKLMAAAQTGLVTNFSQPTAWPTPLELRLVDDCGSPVANGQIVAAFTNGDPPLPLTLADGSSGLYSGTWTPRRTAQQTTITMRATAPGFTSVTTQISGSVTPNSAPLLARNSTQHMFNPLAAGALAPGTLVQVSGTGLSSKVMAALPGALPTTLNGTQVLIGGIPAPLSLVSPVSIAAELPFGLTPGMQYQILVSANGALTTPDTVQLSGTSPGLATVTGGLVAAMHLDGSAVTEMAPAAPGETLVMLGAGLGLTDTAVADGAVSPADPLANAVSMPTLTIDGDPAAILFAGLQPGTVGIYQINFTVPASAKNGDLALVLSQDGQPANATVLPVKAKP